MKKPKSNRKQKATKKKKKKAPRVRKSNPDQSGIFDSVMPDPAVLARVLERIDRLAELDDEDIAALQRMEDERDFTGMEKSDQVDFARAEAFFLGINFDALPLAPDSPEWQALDEAKALLATYWPSPAFMYDMRPNRFPIGRAYRALEISPHCAEAYAILGWHCTNLDDEVKLYKMALKVATNVLGSDFLDECFGDLSWYDEAEPFMFSLASLLQFYIKTRNDHMAVKHAQAMLAADEPDLAGIRYFLLPKLIEMDADDDAEEVYAVMSPDASTTVVYSRALLDFRQFGDTDIANASLTSAFRMDEDAALYLTGDKTIPGDDKYDIFSDRNESDRYPVVNRKVWQKTEGAIRWMKNHLVNFDREWYLKEEDFFDEDDDMAAP